MHTPLNYADQYQSALLQQFPHAMYFGALFATPNNNRFRWVNSHVIEVPTITTTGRIDGDRDTIGTATRNFNNEWTPLTLANHRTWKTTPHPRDIDETNMVANITNITRVYNEEQKIPEMQAYLGQDPETLLAEALKKKPKLLILDEPCMNLGLAAAKKLCATVAAYLKKNPKTTAICIAHRPEHVPTGFDQELNLDTRKDS